LQLVLAVALCSGSLFSCSLQLVAPRSCPLHSVALCSWSLFAVALCSWSLFAVSLCIMSLDKNFAVANASPTESDISNVVSECVPKSFKIAGPMMFHYGEPLNAWHVQVLIGLINVNPYLLKSTIIQGILHWHAHENGSDEMSKRGVIAWARDSAQAIKSILVDVVRYANQPSVTGNHLPKNYSTLIQHLRSMKCTKSDISIPPLLPLLGSSSPQVRGFPEFMMSTACLRTVRINFAT
jgi:hypothetical protein